MDIKGQKMFKVVSILMIIFGALGLASNLASIGISDTLTLILGLLGGVLMLAAGILGVQAAGTPSVNKIKIVLALDILQILLVLVNIAILAFSGMLTALFALGAVGIITLIISIIFALILPVLHLFAIISFKNGLLELMGGGE